MVVRSRLNWRALGPDAPFETRWESGLQAYGDRGGQRLNAELVRQGYAQVATFSPKVKPQDLCLKLQREAREARRGLWAEYPPRRGRGSHGHEPGARPRTS
jgi:endonuclease YncB( thermonuclease family)